MISRVTIIADKPPQGFVKNEESKEETFVLPKESLEISAAEQIDELVEDMFLTAKVLEIKEEMKMK